MTIDRKINDRAGIDRYSRRDLTARHAKRIRKGQRSGYSGSVTDDVILRWNEYALTLRRIAAGLPIKLVYQNNG
jgi:hypothetical protein